MCSALATAKLRRIRPKLLGKFCSMNESMRYGLTMFNDFNPGFLPYESSWNLVRPVYER